MPIWRKANVFLSQRSYGLHRFPSEVISTVPAEKATPDVRYESDGAPLFPNNELEDLRNRWKGVQTAFVDEPVARSNRRTDSSRLP
jgi:hypothetical protein